MIYLQISIIFYSILGLYVSSSKVTPNFNLKQKVQWLTLSEVEEKMKVEQKDILVDVYTEWCGWCKTMDKKTYNNEHVAAYINEHYYAVKINAEAKTPLIWKNKQYNFNERYRANDLVLNFTAGRLSYPTTVIVTKDGAQPQPIPGYLRVSDMELILRYFGDGHYQKTMFKQYQESFKHTWK